VAAIENIPGIPVRFFGDVELCREAVKASGADAIVDMRCAPAIRNRPESLEIIGSVAIRNCRSKALKARVGSARCPGMMVGATLVTLPDFHPGPVNRSAVPIHDGTVKVSLLAR